MLAWTVIESCRFQLRVGMAGAFALDMGAVLSMADHLQIQTPLLAEILPEIEAVLVTALKSAADEGGETEDPR
jgi:hypothetical protein